MTSEKKKHAGPKVLWEEPERPRRVERIVTALRAGASYEAAARQGGISEDTFSRWRKAYAEFADAVSEAESDAETMFTARIVQHAENDWRPAAWWLERRRPQHYGRKPEQTTVNAESSGGDVKITIERVESGRRPTDPSDEP